MPTRYRTRSQAAARVIQRAAVAYLRRKGNKRARTRPRPSTRRATKPLTRGDVLKIIKSKQDPKVFKTPITTNTFVTTTVDDTANCRNLNFGGGANEYAGTSFTINHIRMPYHPENQLFLDSDSEYGDIRDPPYFGSANPDSSEIVLNRITARIDYTSHTGQDYMLNWYLFRLEKLTTIPVFTANLHNSKIITQYKSYLTSHQQRNEQDARTVAKDQKIIKSGKMLIKRSSPYNDAPIYKTLKVSHSLGKNGKKVKFASNSDQIGDIGAFVLVTSITAKNGNIIGNTATTGLIQTGLLTTYWQKVLSNN